MRERKECMMKAMRKYLLPGMVAAMALTGFILPSSAAAVEPAKTVIGEKGNTEGYRDRRRWNRRRRRGGSGISFGFSFGAPRYHEPRYYYVQPAPVVVVPAAPTVYYQQADGTLTTTPIPGATMYYEQADGTLMLIQ